MGTPAPTSSGWTQGRGGLTEREAAPLKRVMTDDKANAQGASSPSQNPTPRTLPPAAQRALTEAAERRAAQGKADAAREPEHAGPKGPEPTRYGDWERKGIASDF